MVPRDIIELGLACEIGVWGIKIIILDWFYWPLMMYHIHDVYLTRNATLPALAHVLSEL